MRRTLSEPCSPRPVWRDGAITDAAVCRCDVHVTVESPACDEHACTAVSAEDECKLNAAKHLSSQVLLENSWRRSLSDVNNTSFASCRTDVSTGSYFSCSTALSHTEGCSILVLPPDFMANTPASIEQIKTNIKVASLPRRRPVETILARDIERRHSLRIKSPRQALQFMPMNNSEILLEMTPYQLPTFRKRDVLDNGVIRLKGKPMRRCRQSREPSESGSESSYTQKDIQQLPHMAYASLYQTAFLRSVAREMQREAVGTVVLPSSGGRGNGSSAAYGGRAKLVHTLCLIVTYFTLGVCSTTLGSTLVDVEARLLLAPAQSCFLFSARGLGGLLGSLAVGRLFARLHWFMAVGLALLLCAVTTFVFPLANSFLVAVCVTLLQGIFLGFLDCGTNALCMLMWSSDYTAPLRSMHLLYGVGSVVGPVVTARFVTPADASLQPNATAARHRAGLANDSASAVGGVTPRGWRSGEVSGRLFHSVFMNDQFPMLYAYFVAALLLVVVAVVSLSVWLSSERRAVPKPCVDSGTEAGDEDGGGWRRDVIRALRCVFQCSHVGVELTYQGLLASVAVRQLGWSRADACHLSAVTYATYAAGRAAGSLLAGRLSASTALSASVVAMLAAFALSVHSVASRWLTGVLTGAAMAAVLPASLAYMERRDPSGPNDTRRLMLVSGIGMTLVPAAVGYLAATLAPPAFDAVQLGLTAVNALVLVAIHVLAKSVQRRRDHDCLNAAIRKSVILY